MNIRILTAAAALLALLSCASPLDVGTQRIDTQLTNLIKIRSVEVNARIAGPSDTVKIEGWTYDVASSTLSVDTASTPPTISLNRRMVQPAGGSGTWLKELRIRLDGVSADGATTISGDPGTGTGIAAQVMVDGIEYSAATGYTASSVLHFQRGAKQEIQGTMLIGVDRSPAFTLLIAVNIAASQD